jgi:streptogramin lyase
MASRKFERHGGLALVVLAGLWGCSSSSAPPPIPDASVDGARPDAAVSAPDAAAPDAAADTTAPDTTAPDAATADTALSDGAADGAPEGPDAAPADGGLVACGTTKVGPSAGVMDSLVVAPDGTIYFTHGLGDVISRIRPGMPEETPWIRTGISSDLEGIIYDPAGHTLYAASRFRIELISVEMNNPVAPNLGVRRVPGGGIYGLTLGEDHALYYLDEWNGSVYRIAIDGWTSSRVVTGIPGRPHGLAFGPDGWLYLTQTEGNEVWRVKLENGHETAREKFATAPAEQGRGIAFDQAGTLYLTTGKLLSRFDRAGALIDSVPSGDGGLDFGAGALGCGDLYVAGSEGLRVHAFGTPGLSVPWHRAL